MSGGEKIYPDILSAPEYNMPGPHGKREAEISSIAMTSERISGWILSLAGKKLSGTMTVEAALVLPLFWYFIAGFLYLLLFLRLQENISQALADTGYFMAQYTYQTESLEEAGALLVVRQKMRDYLTDPAVEVLLTGGGAGIQIDCDFQKEEAGRLRLCARYQLRTPWKLIGIREISVSQEQVCRIWIGYQGTQQVKGGDQVVYITPYGLVYHKSLDCRHLQLSIRQISQEALYELRNRDGAVYDSCESCGQEGTMGASIYVTDYGDCYHTQLDCIGLKRTVFLVMQSEAMGRTACSSCCGKQE